MYKVAVVAPEKFEMTAESLEVGQAPTRVNYSSVMPSLGLDRAEFLTLNLYNVTLPNASNDSYWHRSFLQTPLPFTFTIYGDDGRYVMGALFKNAYVVKVESAFYNQRAHNFAISKATIKIYSWEPLPVSPKENPGVISRQIIIYRGKR